jgi:hypothetical protein
MDLTAVTREDIESNVLSGEISVDDRIVCGVLGSFLSILSGHVFGTRYYGYELYHIDIIIHCCDRKIIGKVTTEDGIDYIVITGIEE